VHDCLKPTNVRSFSSALTMNGFPSSGMYWPWAAHLDSTGRVVFWQVLFFQLPEAIRSS
jgi:hypothetical protein